MDERFILKPILINIHFYWLLQISNGIGVISGTVQLILYGYYWCRGDNQIGDDDKGGPVPVVTAVWSDYGTSFFQISN